MLAAVSTAGIIVLAVLGFFLLLAIGGAFIVRRRTEAGAAAFTAEIERANRDLAAAHASDNGWEPSRVTEAARQAFSQERPGVAATTIELIQVVDPPGTEDDKAVFRVETAAGEHRLTLGRHGDHWHFETLT